MNDRIETHLRETDAFAWYMEHDALLRSTVVAVVKLERAPDWERLVGRVDRATRLVPTFRDVIVEPPLRLSTPQWVPDPGFDLSFHLRRLHVPAPHTFAEVLRYARTTAMAGFDRARPLWEFTLMEGLDDGGAAFVMKVHHGLTDGIGGMQLALLLFDLDPDAEPTDDLETWPDPESRGHEVLDRVRDAVDHDVHQVLDFAGRHVRSAVPSLMHAALHPRETVIGALNVAASIARIVAPVTQTLSPVMTDRTLSWNFQVLELPFMDLRRAAKKADGTLNDAFLAGIAGGLRRYHELHGESVDELRVTLPISIRKESDPTGGNRITLMRFKVPIAVVDPVERMRAMHTLVAQWRNEPAIRHTNTIAGLLNLLPRNAVGSILKHVDFLASNVPGVSVPLYLVGAKVDRYFPFGPTTGSAVNITLLTYVDSCCIGVNTDTGAIPDSDEFLACLREGFDEVLAVARPPTPRRQAAPRRTTTEHATTKHATTKHATTKQATTKQKAGS